MPVLISPGGDCVDLDSGVEGVNVGMASTV